MSFRSALRRPRTWFIAVPIAVAVAVVVGPFVYIHFIKEDAPDRLTFEDPTTTSAALGTTAAGDDPTTTSVSAAGLDGAWTIAGGSIVGYRVNEVLFGQSAEAVGRTSAVTGELTISGTTVTDASFTADLTQVQSDESRRDGQFQGRIMDTATFPTATFVLASPIELTSIPDDLVETTVQATGQLTLRGVTRSVTFSLAARRNGGTIEVNGTIPIVFDDYSIPEPSFGPTTVEDHGAIEFLLVFGQA
jgi:polyisoprenoid-binding protein YceI